MAIRGYFVRSGRNESIDKFAASFREPTLIRIVQAADDFRISAPKHFDQNSHFWISEKLQQKRVLLRTKCGRILSVALDSPTKFQVVFRHTVGPPATLKEIFKHTQCSGDVTVFITGNPNLLLSNRPDLSDPVAYGELKILSTVEETCLLGHALTGMTLESDAMLLSVRAPIFVEIVTSYKSKSLGEFRQWTASLGQQVATLRENMKTSEQSSTYPDIVLLTARIGENASNSEHSCFMYSVDDGVVKSSVKKRESVTMATAISSGVVDVLEPKTESVDVHVLKSRFEARSDVSPSATHAKTKSATLVCTEKSSPGCPSAAVGTTKERGSDFSKVSRCHSLSSQNLVENSETKTSTISRSDARELGKNATLERAEITQPILKPGHLFFSGSPDVKKEMARLRSKSQENLLDIFEKDSKVGSCPGARSAAAQSFQEKKVAFKATAVEVVKARTLTSALAKESSSDDDDCAYEDVDDLSSEDTNSAARSSFRLFGRARAQSDSKKSSKDSKPKKPAKCQISKRPLPHPPKEEVSDARKRSEMPPTKAEDAAVQGRYMKISHAANDDGENPYASLREDSSIPGSFVVVPPSADDDDDVSWRGAERKEWRKMKDAAEIPRDVDVARLTVDEVGHCLRLLKMKKYVKKFKQRVVDGAVLVSLTDAMLVETFKMDQLDARKIVMFSKENWRPSKK